MSDTGPAEPGGLAAPGEGLVGKLPFRRRRFLVNPSYQIRFSALAAVATLVLLLLLNVSLFLSDRDPARGADTAAPELGRMFHSEDRFQFGLLLAGSLTFLVGVFAVGILETHRTAGAAFAIRRTIESVREGDLRARVRLRRGDHLQDLGSALNALASRLAEDRAEEADRLRALAERAEESGAFEIGRELRRLIDAKGRTLGA